MNVLLDMNLSYTHVPTLNQAGFNARHWSDVGSHDALDSEIVTWAAENDCVIITHDLDFGSILATLRLDGPSVILLRCGDTISHALTGVIIGVLRQFRDQLESGSLIVVDEFKTRVRILPL